MPYKKSQPFYGIFSIKVKLFCMMVVDDFIFPYEISPGFNMK